jgi:hypothetical protein
MYRLFGSIRYTARNVKSGRVTLGRPQTLQSILSLSPLAAQKSDDHHNPLEYRLKADSCRFQETGHRRADASDVLTKVIELAS